MSRKVTYHVGGFVPTASAENKSEEWDGASNLYTRWNASGVQQEQRALTAEEAQELSEQDVAATADTNGRVLREKAAQALTSNATYLAIATPTAAQNTAQVKSLTRQVNALIRLQIRELGDVSNT